MKAAVFDGPPGSWPEKPLALRELPCPKPGQGEVLLRVDACGLCRTDLEYMSRGMRPPKNPPLVLGHEISGTVEETGQGVEDLTEGDRVIVSIGIPCGQCSYCQRGRTNLCVNAEVIGADRDGGLAEFVLAPAEVLFRLPESIASDAGAVLTDCFGTSYHALMEVGHVQPGDTVAIYGVTGGLGLGALQIATALGARVIGIGRQPWKLEKASSMGALSVVSTREFPQPEKEVARLSGGGADISVDASGAPEMIAAACRSTRPGGKVVVMSFGIKSIEVPLHRLMWFEYGILGSRNYRREELSRVLAMAEAGMVHPEDIISHRFPLAEVNEGYQMLQEGKVLRAVVVP